MKRRLALGVAANAAGKGWIVLAQLVTVPALTHAWGPKGYGMWLMVTALPTYIALSDFGFGAAGAVEMTRAFARDDHAEMRRVFQSVWVLVTSVCAAMALLLLLLAGIAPALLANYAPSSQYGFDVIYASLFVSLGALCSMQMAVIGAGFRSTGKYAVGVFLNDLVYPLSTVALVCAALTGHGMAFAAACIAMVNAVAVPAYYLLLRRFTPYLSIGFKHASASVICRLAKPSFATLGLTLSHALALQGMVISIGLCLGPAAAGVFGAARTIVRAPLQLVGLASRASLPELTVAFANGSLTTFRRLLLLSLAFAVAVAVPAAAALAVFGPYALNQISHGTLYAAPAIFLGLGTAMVAEAAWTTLGQGLIAVNKQQLFTPFYIPLAALMVIAPKFLSELAHVTYLSALAQTIMLALVSATTFNALARHKPEG